MARGLILEVQARGCHYGDQLRQSNVKAVVNYNELEFGSVGDFCAGAHQTTRDGCFAVGAAFVQSCFESVN